jgi:CDP-4-dehydro-6-deoxyglucose reductase, E1
MREEVLSSVKRFYEANRPPLLVAGQDYLPASGKVIDSTDLEFAVDAVLDMWFTTGRFAKSFEKKFAEFMGQKFCLLVNSGSSANLLAFAALTSPQLGEKRIKSGDEIITVAAGFPTTVNPIYQHGCVPVFIDVDPSTHQIDHHQLEEALSPKTKAVMVAHALGNPFDAHFVKEFCDKHGLWFIEDCCDAVGAKFQGKPVGTFGHIATTSFYPAHHMTMGEGGSVLTSDPLIKKILESFRDWGRDCWCPTGRDNTCGKRFEQSFADLPEGYDHKYVYSHVGYNLKLTDMQAALGLSQLKKLPEFIRVRNRNFSFLRKGLSELSDVFEFTSVLPEAEPSWFGFALKVRLGAPKSRKDIVRFLEAHKVGTRSLFGGNLIKQPLYQGLPKRVIGDLPHSNIVMKDVFWIGVYPALQEEHLSYMIKTIKKAVRN